MNVQERFIQYLQEQALCQPHERILLAVSGGKDSVLMAHLFARAGYAIGIAHCNFRLRGEAADADEALVYLLAKTLRVPFYATAFETEAHAQQTGVSIQMAARKLRYEWFEAIRVTQGYDYIAVAQHQNDNMETLLLNLVRGTGLAGLRGIQPKRNRIIRPLLFLSSEEVQAYVHAEGLEYRDDASNYSTKYARNKIRLEVVPKLKELNPVLEYTFAENMVRFTDAYTVLQAYVEELRNGLFTEFSDKEWHISVAKLMDLQPRRFLLYELFKPFGFTEPVLSDLEGAIRNVPGKQFRSPSHVLYLNRGELVLKPMETEEDMVATIERPGNGAQWDEYRFESSLSTDRAVMGESHIAQFDADKITFPIQIRAWQEADVFYPLGMSGKKKLSDLFVSLKIPVYQKRSVPVVVNGNGDIIWVAPHRMDDRYKITGKTKKVFTLACF
ncbi:tRNA lysidine(34) synthetase TilS [Parapedobacter tibetensis]|uniref:tRNA lysidine(34) synthetase TilS n=1 Tax=Parapedobacter tibetensis TaxID=2972951 RepID=UPI00214D8C84|nr:tRNA lysidine(34) synthetase TilS [Parapedobacter tibetensis]